MKFRLTTMLWAFALLASALATFGGVGILAFLFVLSLWAIHFVESRYSPLGCLIGIGLAVLLLGLLLPAVQSAREASRRNSCSNNMKQINLGFHNYLVRHKEFPAATQSDPNSEYLHSWRVWILPYMEDQALFNAIRRNQPWDSEYKKNVTNSNWPTYLFECPAHFSNRPITHYFAIVGEKTIWPLGRGRKLSEIKDGTANTIMLIEASHKAVPWAKPEDLTFDEAVELLTDPPATDGYGHEVNEGFFYRPSRGINVAFADGHVRFLRLPIPQEHAVALLTVAGGEDLDPSDVHRLTSPQLDYGRIYGLTLFVLLSLAPIVKLRGKRSSAEEQATGES